MGAMRIRHGIREIATQPVILWILLGGKLKWLPLNFGFNDVMRTAPILETVRGAATYRKVSSEPSPPKKKKIFKKPGAAASCHQHR